MLERLLLTTGGVSKLALVVLISNYLLFTFESL